MDAIIDIGSNSVRLLLRGKKYINNTQLAEGLMNTHILNDNAMQRTKEAVLQFVEQAKKDGIENVYAFATEAVRSANNGKDFINLLKESNVNIELIPSYLEGQLGFNGAYVSGTPAILDVGGASSELTIGNEKGIQYSHSLPLGSVRLKDYAPDKGSQLKYARERVKEYGIVPSFDKLIAIGGSASQLCAVKLALDPYDPLVIHNQIMTYDELNKVVDDILAVKIEERQFIKGLHPKKILVAPAGGIIILAIMEYLNINELQISENDNLEGYAYYKKLKI